MKVVVLGGGSTGEHFVGALRRLDDEAEITLVESRLVGGECSYYACMPTKTMLRGAELSSSLDRAPGMDPQRPHADGVWSWRDQVTSDWDDSGQLEWLEAAAVRLRPRQGARRPARRRRGGRAGARIRPARCRNRLAAGRPTRHGTRGRRLLDEHRGDVDARGAGEPRGHGRRSRRRRARAVLRAHGVAGHGDRARPATARTRARGGGGNHR